MYRNIKYFFLLPVVFLFFLSGCMKKESYPDIPQIEFVSYTNVFDTGRYAIQGILNISFRDGNGDIGFYSDADTFPPYQPGGQYYYNYVIIYFEKQNGVYKQIDLSPPFSSRIPWLTPLDPGKAIKGTISDKMDFMNPIHLYDTIQLKAFIYDRALHQSNVITTPEIILRRH